MLSRFAGEGTEPQSRTSDSPRTPRPVPPPTSTAIPGTSAFVARHAIVRTAFVLDRAAPEGPFRSSSSYVDLLTLRFQRSTLLVNALPFHPRLPETHRSGDSRWLPCSPEATCEETAALLRQHIEKENSIVFRMAGPAPVSGQATGTGEGLRQGGQGEDRHGPDRRAPSATG